MSNPKVIIVDTNILADLLFGDDSNRAEALALRMKYPNWVAPSLWRYELGNVAWKFAKIKPMQIVNLTELMSQIESLLVETVESIDAQAVLALACEHDLTFYDAAFVNLARVRKTVLFTRDKQLLRKVPSSTHAVSRI